MWKETTISLGRVQENQKISLKFQLKDTAENIKIIDTHVSCGCTAPIIEKDGLKIEYTAKPVPPHLVDKGEYSSTKYIKVTHKAPGEEEKQTTLSFDVTVFK